MHRSELINHLLSSRHERRYLEIGVHAEEDNFAHVRSERKVGVDVNSVATFRGTSDEFFSQNLDAFDVIFIDGLHTEEQASKDIQHAYCCLSPGGAIVLHDCMPPDAWHQRPPEEYTEGEPWNGTVWKAALREFNRTTHRCLLVDTDWGCGVIDTSADQAPRRRSLPDCLDYERDYPMLLDYTISAAELVRERVRVFYHLACTGNWREVFTEQIGLLDACSFPPVDLTVLGDAEDLRDVHEICEALGRPFNLVFHSPELTHFETPSLLAIEAYARENDGYVLYLHSKGVSSPDDELKARWRELMMRELVENWERCMLELPHYDAIGVNWRDMPPVSHFSGNFWYAATRYLRTLPDFRAYYESPQYRIWDPIHDKRLGCEFWIGSGDTPPHVLSLACRNEDFCSPGFWAAHP
jgi:hypothetical protein